MSSCFMLSFDISSFFILSFFAFFDFVPFDMLSLLVSLCFILSSFCICCWD